MRVPPSPSPVTAGAEAKPDTLGAAAAAPRKPRKLPSIASFASISSITKVFSKRHGSSKARSAAAHPHHHHDLESCVESNDAMPRECGGGGDGRGEASSSSPASSVVATCGGPRIRRNFSFQSSSRQPVAARKVGGGGGGDGQQQARVFTEPADRMWGFGSLRRITVLPRSKTMGVLPTMKTTATATETTPMTSRLPVSLRAQKTRTNVDERHVRMKHINGYISLFYSPPQGCLTVAIRFVSFRVTEASALWGETNRSLRHSPRPTGPDASARSATSYALRRQIGPLR